MTDNYIDSMLDVTPPGWKSVSSMIKVIGVGGGGCNAVTYMYDQKLEGCTFIVCNTDSQALQDSDVPVKIQMGRGLGAGTDPSEGRKAALESQEEIERLIFDDATQMVFITAGMGGGTGTGAAPVIAKMAKDRKILTVGVVTVPFDNEGNESLSKAIDGIHEMEKNVDSLLVIKNQKIIEVYGDLLIQDAFPKSNEVLMTAIKSITEIIARTGYINVDFKDVKKMMSNSGCALMGSGCGTGENRIKDAVHNAFHSPLLNEFDLKSARDILLNVTVGYNDQGVLASQYEEINEEIKKVAGSANRFKQGLIYDKNPEFGDKIVITAIVTGLHFSDIIGPGEDIGNYIMIDKDFKYVKPDQNSGEVHIPGSYIPHTKIGFNTKENIRTFHFDGSNVPELIVKPGDDKSRLENEPAIRRIVRNEKKV
ncbi:MAG: cell division protein FtsZ [Bacteroidales bacterium]|nr:cell division protein FtsZ [Bacteroidales bacterium]